MQIKKLIVGPLQTNCYIITINNQTIIIDPGADANKIINECQDKNVVAIFVTHYHFDHIEALEQVNAYFQVPINPLTIPNISYEIIHTPGHKEDCITIYLSQYKTMFVGDFIFLNSIGRIDLEGGNALEMKKSLEMIKKFPNDITLYPGHGLQTMLGKEKENFWKYF